MILSRYGVCDVDIRLDSNKFYPNLDGLTASTCAWIVMVSNPSLLLCRNLFSFPLYSKRSAKNTLFEVISLHSPTGPLDNP
jgi:hypothetical protein